MAALVFLLALPLARPAAPPSPHGSSCSRGQASYYADEFAGKKTASGEPYDPVDRTAAHRSLPFGTRVLVENGERSVIVRINDRGPFHGGAVIDLSRAAAGDLGIVDAGRAHVRLCRL
ncbi:MAG: septal ring lytic transglycosylase RlpA family protein [Polyangiaceae bacterium]|jgi:rare lipoprotein A|nr:septal ring lytic transglycosylase RlpA family protein [Polyangiaceae bacterium]